jgi:hypothetical protein
MIFRAKGIKQVLTSPSSSTRPTSFRLTVLLYRDCRPTVASPPTTEQNNTTDNRPHERTSVPKEQKDPFTEEHQPETLQLAPE